VVWCARLNPVVWCASPDSQVFFDGMDNVPGDSHVSVANEVGGKLGPLVGSLDLR